MPTNPSNSGARKRLRVSPDPASKRAKTTGLPDEGSYAGIRAVRMPLKQVVGCLSAYIDWNKDKSVGSSGCLQSWQRLVALNGRLKEILEAEAWSEEVWREVEAEAGGLDKTGFKKKIKATLIRLRDYLREYNFKQDGIDEPWRMPQDQDPEYADAFLDDFATTRKNDKVGLSLTGRSKVADRY